jgi:hypothetical protein
MNALSNRHGATGGSQQIAGARNAAGSATEQRESLGPRSDAAPVTEPSRTATQRRPHVRVVDVGTTNRANAPKEIATRPQTLTSDESIREKIEQARAARRIEQARVARDKRSVTAALLQGALLMLVVSAPVIALWLDIQLLGNSIGEVSVTELSQLGLLALTVGMFGWLAQRVPADRRFATLAAGFFACMLIRECDAWLDMVFDGLWQILAIATAGVCVTYALRDWRATLRGMARLVTARSGFLLIVALVLLLVYSRLLGMGSLWKGLLSDEYVRVFKNSVEEGSELLGYSLIAAAAASYAWSRTRRLKQR